MYILNSCYLRNICTMYSLIKCLLLCLRSEMQLFGVYISLLLWNTCVPPPRSPTPQRAQEAELREYFSGVVPKFVSYHPPLSGGEIRAPCFVDMLIFSLVTSMLLVLLVKPKEANQDILNIFYRFLGQTSLWLEKPTKAKNYCQKTINGLN